ncbi:hypothetical protein [Butyrivibrio fibrisolvens]|uniref:hypothetical protein n=1 Tax=Butyrivibrio fibrisolvens TaxID=831 RepID=UPI000414E43F|nr:hypothetical protein [Butyrivibrio fibrisolvens]
MKKKIMSVWAAVLLLCYTCAFSTSAATSPTTSNVTIITNVYVNGGGSGGGNSGGGGGRSSGGGGGGSSSVPCNSTGAAYVIPRSGPPVRISSTYSGVTDGRAVSTAISPKPGTDSLSDTLMSYVNAVSGGRTVIGPFKLRMYVAGVSIWSGFGTFTSTYGVGNGYEGRSVTIYQIHQDGSVTAASSVVSGGKVSVTMDDMGSFAIVVN